MLLVSRSSFSERSHLFSAWRDVSHPFQLGETCVSAWRDMCLSLARHVSQLGKTCVSAWWDMCLTLVRHVSHLFKLGETYVSAWRDMCLSLVRHVSHLGETCVSPFSAWWDMCVSLVRHVSHFFQLGETCVSLVRHVSHLFHSWLKHCLFIVRWHPEFRNDIDMAFPQLQSDEWYAYGKRYSEKTNYSRHFLLRLFVAYSLLSILNFVKIKTMFCSD